MAVKPPDSRIFSTVSPGPITPVVNFPKVNFRNFVRNFVRERGPNFNTGNQVADVIDYSNQYKHGVYQKLQLIGFFDGTNNLLKVTFRSLEPAKDLQFLIDENIQVKISGAGILTSNKPFKLSLNRIDATAVFNLRPNSIYTIEFIIP